MVSQEEKAALLDEHASGLHSCRSSVGFLLGERTWHTGSKCKGGWEYGMSSRRRSISVRWTKMDVINSATMLPRRIRSAGWSPLRSNPLCAVRDGRLYYDPQLRPVVDPAAAALLAYLLSISCKPSLRQSQSGRPWTWIPAFAW